MKILPYLLILFPLLSAAQPDPRDLYPFELQKIEERIKKDSSNPSLRWRRAYMKIPNMILISI